MEIEGLDLRITADSKNANNAIKGLIGNLDAVKSSLKGFDAKQFTQMTQQLKLTQAAVETLTAKLKVLGSSKVKVDLDTQGITQGAKFISSKTASLRRELAGLQPVAEAAMNGDSSALTSFDRKVMSIKSGVAQLKSELSQFGDTKIESAAFTANKEQIAELKSQLKELKAQEQELISNGTNLEGNAYYDGIKTSIDETIAKISELEAKQQEMVASGTDTTDPFASARQFVGQFEGDLTGLENKVHETAGQVNNTEIKPNVEGSKISIKSVISGLKELSGAVALVKKTFSTIGNAVTKPIKAMKSGLDGIKGAFDKVHGFMDKGFMKILRYGFGIRSLYVLFRRLKQAIIDSFGELQKSGAFVQETKTNIESLKASLTTLKFQFGAAFQPIFNAIAPALQTLINYLVSVMNIISAFTAKLMGKSTYSKAVASTGAIAGNMGSAAGSAKELNKQLQGFDELNNLTSNSPGGGGGGGGGGGAGSGANYVTESVDSVLGDFAKELAEKIKQGDWYGVGRAISDKLVEAMQSIDWNKIYEKAKDFGRGLAEFLNGLITPELFGELGKTLANALNTAFYGLLEFAKTFDWNNLGESIATGINEFFTNADFAAWGETVHEWIGGILDAGISLLDTVDFEQIGTKLADFINNIDIPDLLGKIAVVIHKLLQGIRKLLGALWDNLGSDLKKSIGNYFLDFLGFLSPTATYILGIYSEITEFGGGITDRFKAVGEAIGKALEKIKTIIKNAFNTLLNGGGTTTGYNGMPSDVANQQFGSKGLKDFGASIINGIKEGFTNVLDKFDVIKQLYDKIKKDFETIFDSHSPAKKMYPLGESIFGGILKGFMNALKKNGKDFMKNLRSIFEGNDSQWSGNGKPGANFEITISGVVDSLIGIENLKSKFNLLKTAWQGRTSEFKTKMTGAIKSIDETLGLTEKFGNLRKGWEGASATFNAKVGEQITKITDLDTWKSKFNALKSKWSDDSATLSATVGGQITKIGDLTTWKTAITSLRAKWLGKNANYTFNANTTANTMDAYGNAMDRLHSKWYGASASFTVTTNIADDAVQQMVKKVEEARLKLQDALDRAQNSVVMKKKENGGWITATNAGNFANGGIIKGYANGGRPHGTMFLAGEAGPEIVGHVGGRTEVLNKSQLAVTMANAVKLGMASGFNNINMSLDMPTTSYGSYASSGYNDSVIRQNQLLEEQNRLLREIADKDPNIKVQDVFDATRKGAREYYNRTGNSPFLF